MSETPVRIALGGLDPPTTLSGGLLSRAPGDRRLRRKP